MFWTMDWVYGGSIQHLQWYLWTQTGKTRIGESIWGNNGIPLIAKDLQSVCCHGNNTASFTGSPAAEVHHWNSSSGIIVWVWTLKAYKASAHAPTQAYAHMIVCACFRDRITQGPLEIGVGQYGSCTRYKMVVHVMPHQGLELNLERANQDWDSCRTLIQGGSKGFHQQRFPFLLNQ